MSAERGIAARERALSFPCAGETLVGVLHEGGANARVGVLVVVGGPQYRVGSHRQFVDLARRLAMNGVPVLRFDYRGMGDSSGASRTFEQIDADISAAIDAYTAALPGLRKVVLWGLCDGASAIAMYAHDEGRVAGRILLNPWVRTESGHARALVGSYYLRRMGNPEFWRKLLSGRFRFRAAFSEFRAALGKLRAGPADLAAAPSGTGQERPHYVERMRLGLAHTRTPTWYLLSGNDLTADEFRQLVRSDRRWRRIMRAAAAVHTLPQATHTFSSAAWKAEVAARTLHWVRTVATE